jgi:hypothetical protein
MKVLVLDIGGSNVKLRVTGQEAIAKIPTGPNYTPQQLVADLPAVIAGWEFDAVTVGFPAPIVAGKIPFEPQNLGTGWVDFRFSEALGKPVRLINDAAMQAVGCYDGGRMLFLSLGTGLGSALIVDYHIIGLELCQLRWSRQQTIEGRLGKPALKRLGKARWIKCVGDTVNMLRAAFVPDSIKVGGGSAKHLKRLPDGVHLVPNSIALTGGELLWTDPRFWMEGL